MCYHISQKSSKKTLEKKFNAIFPDGLNWNNSDQKINGFAHPGLPVIKSEDKSRFMLQNWGLIPGFVKDNEQALKLRTMTLNAKCETVFEKPSFRSVIMSRRCIIPIDGFYEWKIECNMKIMHYIRLKNNEPFALGGVWDSWLNNETGEVIETFSIITTPANPLMAEIHNIKQRMPLILDENAISQWLDASADKAKVSQLMIPFDQDQMHAEPMEPGPLLLF